MSRRFGSVLVNVLVPPDGVTAGTQLVSDAEQFPLGDVLEVGHVPAALPGPEGGADGGSAASSGVATAES